MTAKNTNCRPEIAKLLPRYQIIRDVIEQRVDECGELYLPCPSGIPANARSNDENQRYANYVTRAIFYNYVGRTLTGFIGQIYSRDAEIKVPDQLKALVKDATGDGLSLEQLSKDACAEVLSVGRYGLLTDYPSYESAPTVAQIASGEARPVIMPYLGENIVDWQFEKRGAKWILSYVELLENYDSRDTETNVLTVKEQRRELKLVDGKYIQRVWREDDEYGNRDVSPKANGKQLTEIPFTFIGCVNNDASPDLPPMYDMAKINIGHYRNSADYEESVFLIGQPTFVVTGISQKWWEQVLNKVLKFGARNGLTLEKDSDAKILQALPNTLAKEAMDTKQEQLAAMGAEFLRDSAVQKTATEAELNDSARTSAISNAAKNVSAAFQFALEWAAIFQGQAETTVLFKLNSEFDLARLTEAERAQLIKEYQADGITWTEWRTALHKAGIATLDDEKAKTEISEKAAADLEKATAEFAATNPDPTAGPVVA